jgi:hypothetical protein
LCLPWETEQQLTARRNRLRFAPPHCVKSSRDEEENERRPVITKHDTIPYGIGVKRQDTNLHSATIGLCSTVTSKVPLLSLWGAEPFPVNSLGSLAGLALRPFNQARTPLWACIIGLSQPRPPKKGCMFYVPPIARARARAGAGARAR